jgi:hypothetical protein
MNIREICYEYVDCIQVTQDPVVGFCKHCDDVLCFINSGTFLTS